MRFIQPGFVSASLSLLLVACSGSAPTSLSSFGPDGGAPHDGGTTSLTEDTGSLQQPMGGDSGSTTAVDGGDCPPSAKLIYVTGQGSDLYSFDPTMGAFTLIGPLSCLTSPTHMTVDRTGTAWVVDVTGNLFTASTATAACSKVPTWKNTPAFPDYALTFLGTTGTTDNTLYLLGNTGELGSFDVPSGAITKIGTLTLHPFGDMTTNGDGTLYFLMQSAMQTLNQLDPANASVKTSWVTGENSSGDQALAYYGGLFYDFIGATVYTYDTVKKTAALLGTAPLMVTGAGQSTCVPTTSIPPAPLR